MKTVFSFFAMIFFTANAFPQTSYELTCRAKAKEIAASTYSSCVTEARSAHVEEIRSNYQKELSALKSKYDKELKKMGGGQASSKKASKAPTIAEAQSTQPVRGLAKQLPAKTTHHIDATPVQTVSEGAAVVAVGSDQGMGKSADSLEKEASDADQVEIIDMPTE
ncbi:hypothetical protein [Bdellovibrio svalbardensis]|uniref:Uncharacterized protein n=1 Tax=Bdellovibrio svalbardensis TaxID=2972972 RepID=A0ABT6DIL9_9BACT|nr:hypothetical protein [Bdellovibrio svalbardensis]MDG0816369.1 hypothetical protein [Bdellovibrio svalbardensis]